MCSSVCADASIDRSVLLFLESVVIFVAEIAHTFKSDFLVIRTRIFYAFISFVVKFALGLCAAFFYCHLIRFQIVLYAVGFIIYKILSNRKHMPHAQHCSRCTLCVAQLKYPFVGCMWMCCWLHIDELMFVHEHQKGWHN